LAWRAVGLLSRGWCLGLDVVDLGCMAYNFPKIGSTLFTTPVRTTIDLLLARHHHGARQGSLASGLGRRVAADPWQKLGSLAHNKTVCACLWQIVVVCATIATVIDCKRYGSQIRQI